MFDRVRAEHAAGRIVVLFTNQNIRRSDLDLWKQKIQLISKELGVPHHIFVAIRPDPDPFRKPRAGMWKAFVKIWREKKGREIDMLGKHRSFFVGDAAGREANEKEGRGVKDHSNADKGFAEQASLKFFTPEEYCFEFVDEVSVYFSLFSRLFYS